MMLWAGSFAWFPDVVLACLDGLSPKRFLVSQLVQEVIQPRQGVVLESKQPHHWPGAIAGATGQTHAFATGRSTGVDGGQRNSQQFSWTRLTHAVFSELSGVTETGSAQ